MSLFEKGMGTFKLITGRAGTGKSTMLMEMVDKAMEKGDNVAVVAPTGVAAVNVKGVTIHRFFGFNIHSTLENPGSYKSHVRDKLRAVESIIIDEISMVRADLLDMMDKRLRLARKNPLPFGGVDIIAFGDLYQLPPVVKDRELFGEKYYTPFFFGSDVIKKAIKENKFEVKVLKKIYRQTEKDFIEVLNNIREGKKYNRKLMGDCAHKKYDNSYVYIATTNAKASKINDDELKKIDGPMKLYKADIQGEAPSYPVKDKIYLKVGAKVMFMRNTDHFMNGETGTVIKMEKNSVVVEKDNGEFVDVPAIKWEMVRFVANGNKLEKETIGEFSQIPLQLGWAITIHKSQSKTFEKAFVDLGYGAFAEGQVYVALSRCTSLKGLGLKRPIRDSEILVNSDVKDFMELITKK